MRITKKAVSLVLAMLMITSLFTIVPMTVNAAPPDSGTGTGTGGSTTVITPTTAGDDYLTFTAEEAGSSVTLNVSSGSNLQYNKNNSGWQSYTAGTQITLNNVGDYVRFSGKNTTFDYSNHVSIGGKVACSGNVMSLRLDDYGEVQGLSDRCFYYMFKDCAGLTAAPELPETILAENCYNRMFYGCTSLTTAPDLPATTLAESCYDNMFSGCTSLTTAPALPATSLARYCYNGMFYGCTSLTAAPELWATTLEYGCYSNMFSGCENLTTAPELPATSLARYCYSYMFYYCKGLTTAPELPATELEENCYNNMFNGCRSLTTAPELPATTLVYSCYTYMFYGCSGIKLSETQTAEYNVPYSVPSGGNGTTADSYVLNSMFAGTGGTFTGTPEINKTYYVPGPVLVAEVNGTRYTSLQDAIDAAESGDTVTLLADIDFSEVTKDRSAHDRGDELKIDLKDLTLDMDGHTITTVNASVVFTGNGATIENGSFALNHIDASGNPKNGSYGLCIDGYGVENSITLNDLTIEGGINIWDADVEINTTTATATASNFYAIWAEGNSNVVVNSGTFSDNGSSKAKGPIATDKSGTGTLVTVKGGTFNATNKIVNAAAPGSVKFEGGTFTMVVPEEYAAPGFVPSEQDPVTGKYTVVVDTSSPLNPLNVEANSINDNNAFGIKTDYLMGTLLGVQAKSIAGEETSSQEGTYNMRFVACLDTDILQSAEDYGFVVAKLNDTKNYSNTNINGLTAYWGNGEKTVSAKGTYNNVCGTAAYGDPTDNSTAYKYITCAINDVSTTDKFLVRFYVKIGGKYYYAKYSGHDYKYTGCIASWSDCLG